VGLQALQVCTPYLDCVVVCVTIILSNTYIGRRANGNALPPWLAAADVLREPRDMAEADHLYPSGTAGNAFQFFCQRRTTQTAFHL
jgi:hypothetical protein